MTASNRKDANAQTETRKRHARRQAFHSFCGSLWTPPPACARCVGRGEVETCHELIVFDHGHGFLGSSRVSSIVSTVFRYSRRLCGRLALSLDDGACQLEATQCTSNSWKLDGLHRRADSYKGCPSRNGVTFVTPISKRPRSTNIIHLLWVVAVSKLFEL